MVLPRQNLSSGPIAASDYRSVPLASSLPPPRRNSYSHLSGSSVLLAEVARGNTRVCQELPIV